MSVLVIAEVVLPVGSLPGPVELWLGWRDRIARSRRYGQVVRIAWRHRLGRLLRHRAGGGPLDATSSRRELARSLRLALDEAGVTFVKVGQQLSTRGDLLPAEFVEELAALQDSAAPVPWADVTAVLAAELDSPVEQVFAAIDPHPLAAASVAQVHAARLTDGTDVVVKVQRPGVAALVERDLDILGRLARALEKRSYWARSVGLTGLVAGFADALREELDFTIERTNLTAVAGVLAAAPYRGVRVPVPYGHLSTSRVLVMQRLPGSPLRGAGTLLDDLGPDRRQAVARGLLETVLDQLLDSGLFHVDPHPGNVLVGTDGGLCLLDLGSVGRLDSGSRLALGRLLLALGSGDSAAACAALLELVDRPEQLDRPALERAVGQLVLRYAVPGAPLGAAAFSALLRLTRDHSLRIPPQIAAVFRTFATLESTLRVIDPAFDLVTEARAAGRSRLVRAFTPERLRRSAEDELAALLPVLRRLPHRLDRIADAVEHGRLGVDVRLLNDRRDRHLVGALLDRALITVVGAVAGIMAVLFLDMDGGPRVTDTVRLFPAFGYGLLVVAVVLVLRVLVAAFRQERT